MSTEFNYPMVHILLEKAQAQLGYDNTWRIGWEEEMQKMWSLRKEIKKCEQGKLLPIAQQIQYWAQVLAVLCMAGTWSLNDRILICEACGFHPSNDWCILGHKISE